MPVIYVVVDGPDNEVVDIISRPDPTVAPFGAQAFGPTPRGDIFPRFKDATALKRVLILGDVANSIEQSPFLTPQKRAELRGVYNTILPSDVLIPIRKEKAVEIGVLKDIPSVGDDPGKPKVLIHQYIDP